MRRSWAGGAALLALLAAHFQASPALEEKKGYRVLVDCRGTVESLEIFSEDIRNVPLT